MAISEETRRRLSESHKGKKGYWTGKKRSIEDRIKFSISHIGKKVKPEIKIKISKSLKNKYTGDRNSAWKGDKTLHRGIHSWLHKKFNKANHCVNPLCNKISKHFDYANISEIHDHDIRHYIQLCRSCHMLFDHGNLSYNQILNVSHLA